MINMWKTLFNLFKTKKSSFAYPDKPQWNQTGYLSIILLIVFFLFTGSCSKKKNSQKDILYYLLLFLNNNKISNLNNYPTTTNSALFYQIGGKILSKDSRPIISAGLTVSDISNLKSSTFAILGQTSTTAISKTAQTDSEGKFLLWLSIGKYSISVKDISGNSLGEFTLELSLNSQNAVTANAVIITGSDLYSLSEWSSSSISGTSSLSGCNLVGKYDTTGNAYQAWSYDSSASSVDVTVYPCISNIKNEDLMIVYTNADYQNDQTVSFGIDTGVTSYSLLDNSGERSEIKRNVVPDFVSNFDENNILENYNIRILAPTYKVASATGGGTGSINVTKYNWKTSNSSSTSPASCYVSGQSYEQVVTTLRGYTTLSSGKILRVWVADSGFGSLDGQIDSNKVTSIMDAFKGTTNAPGIYDMVEKLVGDEWGNHSFPTSLISSSVSYIDVVFYDIGCDGALSGTVGYFWSANNFLETLYPFSNEALVFFVDTKFMGTKTGATWELTDAAPLLALTTLAHEFQHMIHYYQKNIVKGVSSKTWLNEMLSLLMEDATVYWISGISGKGLVSDANSSLNNYIKLPNCGITAWNENNPTECNNYTDYDTVWAFGGYLVRNYGGGGFVQGIIQNSKTDMDAIDSALSTTGYSITYKEALRRHGASLAMNPSKGALSNFYGYPQKLVKDFFGAGFDLNFQSGNMYGFSNSKPRFYDTPPSKIKKASSFVWHKLKNNTGTTAKDSFNDAVIIPPKSIVTFVLGPNPKG